MNYPPSTRPISTDTVPVYQRQAPRTSWGQARAIKVAVIWGTRLALFAAGVVIVALFFAAR